jgi:hypothetical protein
MPACLSCRSRTAPSLFLRQIQRSSLSCSSSHMTTGRASGCPSPRSVMHLQQRTAHLSST